LSTPNPHLGTFIAEFPSHHSIYRTGASEKRSLSGTELHKTGTDFLRVDGNRNHFA
jgi:hypothetical protein